VYRIKKLEKSHGPKECRAIDRENTSKMAGAKVKGEAAAVLNYLITTL
jgi:hypothetical protein